MPPTPLSLVAFKQLARAALDEDLYRFTRHAERQMAERDLTHLDVINVLRCGHPDKMELENNAWRYHVKTTKICVIAEVDTSREPTRLVFITAWRITP